MASFTNYFLIISLVLSLQFSFVIGLKLQSPTVIIVCEPIVIVWSKGVPPYTISVETPNQLSPLILSNGTSCRWTPNVKPGTPISFRVQDGSGAFATSPVVVVGEGDDETCLKKALEDILNGKDSTSVPDMTATDSVGRTTTVSVSRASTASLNTPLSTSITRSSSPIISRSTNLYIATSPTSESVTSSSTTTASSPTDTNPANSGKKTRTIIAIVVVVIVAILSSFICLGCIICRREAFKMRFRRLLTPYDAIPEAEEQMQTKEMRNRIESIPVVSRRSLQPLRLPRSLRASVRTGRPGSLTPPPSYRE